MMTQRRQLLVRLQTGLLGIGLGLLPSAISGDALADQVVAERPPTARYAQGETLDLALIIQEWRGKFATIPVFTFLCQTQTAVFILEPQSGGYTQYPIQVPGPRALPDAFSSYPLSSIAGLLYWQGTLLIRQTTVADQEALLVFQSADTPAGRYSGCVILQVGEGKSLCPNP